MSQIDARILRRLAALDLPSEAFREVIAIIADITAADELRRHRARERTLRWRLHEGVTVTSPVTSQENRHIEKISSSSNTQSKSKKRKKVSLPENWMPNENGIALAREQGWDDHKIKLEIHRFKDHATQHNRQYADWDAAWRNWVTSPYQHKTNGNGNGARTPTVQDAFDYALDRLSGGPVEGNPPMVDVTPRRS